MPKQLVVILGMHRSGTSLLTKSIELLGYSLGDNLMPAGVDNPKGFFEDLDFVAFNDVLLNQNYSSWDSPRNTSVDAAVRANTSLIESAGELLRQKFSGVEKLVIKDPRMSLLMPFWSERFAENDVQVHYIVSHRSPQDVAASLARRNGFDKRHSYLLDYIYNRSLMRFVGDDAFVVEYQSFLADPQHQLARISDHLGESPDAVAVQQFVNEFVDPSLAHHAHQPEALNDDTAAFGSLIKLHTLMGRRAAGNDASIAGEIESLPVDHEHERDLLEWQLKRDTDASRQREEALHETVSRLSEQIQGLESDVEKARRDFADKVEQVEERDKHVALLKEEVGELGTQLVHSNDLVRQRDREIERTVQDRRDQINAVNQKLNSARKAVQHQIKEISQLGDLISDLYQLDEENKEQIEQQQNRLEEMEKVHQDVMNSVSLRLGRLLTYPIRKPASSLLLTRLADNPTGLRIVGFLRHCLSHPIATLKLVNPRRIKNFYLLMTERQDLVDQIVTNYEEILTPVPENHGPDIHHFSEAELASFELKLPTSVKPVVSVVIPVYNQIDHTLKCLQSIAEHPPAVPFEIVVADDCSTDATEDVLSRIEGLRVVRNPENLRFLRSCNRAVSFCLGEYIFLLNNDTTVKANWLDALVETFESYSDAGIVGSKLVYPDGRLQEAGGIVWSDASAWNFGRLQDPELPEYNYFKEVDYVSGAAIMIPRQLFIQLGLFDDDLAPAYYEDTDLAFSVRAVGKKVYFQPKSVVVHYEGVSHGTDEATGMKQYQVANREKFLKKWSGVLKTEHFANGEQVSTARERSTGKPTVLVIDHYVPHLDKDAGSRSTFLYLKLLIQAGCNVKFLGDNFFRHEPYTTFLQDLGIEVLYGRYYEKNWKQWLRQNTDYIDVVYMMRPHIAEKYIDFVNELEPRPRTIYFGHDLHYLRLKRQAALSDDAEVLSEAAYWKRKEFALFEKFDQNYYPSEVEVSEIHSVNPDLPVKAIPLYPYSLMDESIVEFKGRNDLLFVGGFNHPPNVDGLLWFIETVMPLLVAALPDVRLNVVGSNAPGEITDCASEKIIVHGFISDEALHKLYATVRLSIVPLRFGAGIKGKVLEAMHLGVPVVTTEVGAEGIPGQALSIADSPDLMANEILRLYQNEAQLQQMSDAGRQVIARHFSEQAVLDVIAEDFMIKTS